MGKRESGADKELRRDFGLMISESRRNSRITQEQLSELTGISDVYLRDIEHGNYTATWVIWLRLCTALDIDIGEIQKKYILPEIRRGIQTLGMSCCVNISEN